MKEHHFRSASSMLPSLVYFVMCILYNAWCQTTFVGVREPKPEYIDPNEFLMKLSNSKWSLYFVQILE